MLKPGRGWDSVWERIFSDREWGCYPEIPVVRFIANNFYNLTHKNRSKIKILDLGCGIGAHTWYLAREGFSVYGIDGSKTAVKLTRKRLAEENLKAQITVGDMIRLPYNSNFFDAVIDSSAIQHNHLKSIKRIIKEVHRVLNFKGKLFSVLVCHDEHLKKDFGKIHYFAKTEIPELFSKFSKLIINYNEFTRGTDHNFHKSWLVEADK